MNANEALKIKRQAAEDQNAKSGEEDQVSNPDSRGSKMVSEALILYVESLFSENRRS